MVSLWPWAPVSRTWGRLLLGVVISLAQVSLSSGLSGAPTHVTQDDVLGVLDAPKATGQWFGDVCSTLCNQHLCKMSPSPSLKCPACHPALGACRSQGAHGTGRRGACPSLLMPPPLRTLPPATPRGSVCRHLLPVIPDPATAPGAPLCPQEDKAGPLGKARLCTGGARDGVGSPRPGPSPCWDFTGHFSGARPYGGHGP